MFDLSDAERTYVGIPCDSAGKQSDSDCPIDTQPFGDASSLTNLAAIQVVPIYDRNLLTSQHPECLQPQSLNYSMLESEIVHQRESHMPWEQSADELNPGVVCSDTCTYINKDHSFPKRRTCGDGKCLSKIRISVDHSDVSVLLSRQQSHQSQPSQLSSPVTPIDEVSSGNHETYSSQEPHENSIGGNSCHICKNNKAISQIIFCMNQDADTRTMRKCRKKYCFQCLLRGYNQQLEDIPDVDSWICPSCDGLCSCASCRRIAEKYGERKAGDSKSVTLKCSKSKPKTDLNSHLHASKKAKMSGSSSKNTNNNADVSPNAHHTNAQQVDVNLDAPYYDKNEEDDKNVFYDDDIVLVTAVDIEPGVENEVDEDFDDALSIEPIEPPMSSSHMVELGMVEEDLALCVSQVEDGISILSPEVHAMPTSLEALLDDLNIDQ